MKCVIVVPVYLENPSDEEMRSFAQCVNILQNHDIFLITFEGLDCSVYEKIANEASFTLKKKLFDKRFFTSVSGYNKLCLSSFFYQEFKEYEYMLIYQLDAWVFRDELDEWVEKGYDFIGAPWFYKYKKGKDFEMLDIVGNGGFSLRKISFCQKVLSNNSRMPLLTPRGVIRTMDNPGGNLLRIFCRLIGFKNNMRFFLEGECEEDKVFASQNYIFGKKKWKFPTPLEASKFSIERNPSYLFELNQCRLPFGCHAYKKYEYDSFWKKYIKCDA